MKRICFPAEVSDGKVSSRATGGKCAERQYKMEKVSGVWRFGQAENLFVPHCSLTQNTMFRTEHDTH